MEWTILKLLNWTTDYLKKRGVASPRLDAELLLAHTLQCSRVQLYTHYDQPLTADELNRFKANVTRRANREPVAYIVGHKEFWALDFQVGPGVLIPRPDTETLVELALKLLRSTPRAAPARKQLPWNQEVESLKAEVAKKALEGEPVFALDGAPERTPESAPDPDVAAPSPLAAPVQPAPQEPAAPSNDKPDPLLVLDVCTGCGIIPICLAKELGARAIGVDISSEALEFARRNVQAHGLGDKVALLQGDLTAPVPARFHGRFDLVTANPPYLTPTEVEGLEPEISRYEPRQALVGGIDGLEFYVRLAREARRMLKPGGHLLLEVSEATQAEQVKRLLGDQGLVEVAGVRDLSGQVRVVKGRLPPGQESRPPA